MKYADCPLCAWDHVLNHELILEDAKQEDVMDLLRQAGQRQKIFDKYATDPSKRETAILADLMDDLMERHAETMARIDVAYKAAEAREKAGLPPLSWTEETERSAKDLP